MNLSSTMRTYSPYRRVLRQQSRRLSLMAALSARLIILAVISASFFSVSDDDTERCFRACCSYW